MKREGYYGKPETRPRKHSREPRYLRHGCEDAPRAIGRWRPSCACATAIRTLPTCSKTSSTTTLLDNLLVGCALVTAILDSSYRHDQDLGFGIQGFGRGTSGIGLRAYCLGCRIQDLGCRSFGLGFGDSGFRC